MPGAESAFKKAGQVDLAAGRRGGVEVHIVDMDIAAVVRFGEFRTHDVDLEEMFRPFRTVLEHHPHRGVAVDIGVFTLDIAVIGILEGDVGISLHQPGVLLANLAPFFAVPAVLQSGNHMTRLFQNFLNPVLNLFDARFGKPFGQKALGHAIGQLGKVFVRLMLTIGVERLTHGIGNLLFVKRNLTTITLNDILNAGGELLRIIG